MSSEQLCATTIGFKTMWVAPCARVLQTPKQFHWHRPQHYRGQWVDFPPFRTISNYFELYFELFELFELFRTIRTISNYSELFRTIPNYFELFRKLFFELLPTISNYSNYFELFLNVRIFHRLWEGLNSRHKNFHCAF